MNPSLQNTLFEHLLHLSVQQTLAPEQGLNVVLKDI